jgi:type IV pilus assembly protein PilN
MIKINLLPVREERRRLGFRQQLTLFALILVLVSIGLFYWHQSTGAQIEKLRGQIAQMDQEIERLAKVVKEVEKYKKDKKTLEGKLDVIGKLQKDRKIAVHYLDELNRALPDRVWLEYYEEGGGAITVRGKALDPDAVPAFMRNLSASPYFSEVDLDVTTQSEVEVGKEMVKVSDFTIRFKAGDGAAKAKKA